VTAVAPVKLFPLITTCVSTGPLAGLKLRTLGMTRNVVLLVRVPAEVVIVTGPIVAPNRVVAFA